MKSITLLTVRRKVPYLNANDTARGSCEQLPGSAAATRINAAVAAMYESLAARHGAERAVLSDGAAELRDAAETLRKTRPDAIVPGDFKHRAANVLKSLVVGDPQFAKFQTQVYRTRSAIPQTELAHLVPPRQPFLTAPHPLRQISGVRTTRRRVKPELGRA